MRFFSVMVWRRIGRAERLGQGPVAFSLALYYLTSTEETKCCSKGEIINDRAIPSLKVRLLGETIMAYVGIVSESGRERARARERERDTERVVKRRGRYRGRG